MTKAEVSGDDGTCQRYSDQGPRTTVGMRSSWMMQREWEKERWAGVNCGRGELWVQPAVVFLHLLCHPQQKNSTLAAPLRSRIATVVKALRFNASTSELRTVRSRILLAVLESELLLSVRIANPPQLEEI